MYGYNLYNLYGPGPNPRHSNKDPVELSPVVEKSGVLLGLRADTKFRDRDKQFHAKYDNAFDTIEKVRGRVEFISTMEELVTHLRLELTAASGDPRKVTPAGKLKDASQAFASDVLGLSNSHYYRRRELDWTKDQATMLYCNIVFLTTEFHVSQIRASDWSPELVFAAAIALTPDLFFADPKLPLALLNIPIFLTAKGRSGNILPRNVDEYVHLKVLRYLHSLVKQQTRQTTNHQHPQSNRKRKRRQLRKTKKQKFAYIRPVKDDYDEVSSFEVMGCADRGGLIRVSDHYGLALLHHTTKVIGHVVSLPGIPRRPRKRLIAKMHELAALPQSIQLRSVSAQLKLRFCEDDLLPGLRALYDCRREFSRALWRKEHHAGTHAKDGAFPPQKRTAIGHEAPGDGAPGDGAPSSSTDPLRSLVGFFDHFPGLRRQIGGHVARYAGSATGLPLATRHNMLLMIWLLSRRNMPTILGVHRQDSYGLDPRSAWWKFLLRSRATLPVDMLLGGGGGSVRLLMLARYLKSSSPILNHLKIDPSKLKAYTTALLKEEVHVKGLRAQLAASGCLGENVTQTSAASALKRLAKSTTTMALRVHTSIQHLRAQRLLREDILAHACNAWKAVMSARATCASFCRLFDLEEEVEALTKCGRRVCNHFAPDIYPWAHALASCHGRVQGYAVVHDDPLKHSRDQAEMLCRELLPPLKEYVMAVLRESVQEGRTAVVGFVPATVTEARSFKQMLRAWDADVLSSFISRKKGSKGSQEREEDATRDSRRRSYGYGYGYFSFSTRRERPKRDFNALYNGWEECLVLREISEEAVRAAMATGDTTTTTGYARHKKRTKKARRRRDRGPEPKPKSAPDTGRNRRARGYYSGTQSRSKPAPEKARNKQERAPVPGKLDLDAADGLAMEVRRYTRREITRIACHLSERGRAQLRRGNACLTAMPSASAMVWAVLRGVDDRDWVHRRDALTPGAAGHEQDALTPGAAGPKRKRSTAFEETRKEE